MTTPGHTAEDASTLVTADEGLVVLTHLRWTAEGPGGDRFAPDRVRVVGVDTPLTMRPTAARPWPPARDLA
ncbi:hypothetical protein [Streptomyces sp. NPDC001137]|uniref:hypothetical protein n=1 Tax=Streptomyces sp. NPDC001137 TaxID=3154378 RepID=UPI00332CB46B